MKPSSGERRLDCTRDSPQCRPVQACVVQTERDEGKEYGAQAQTDQRPQPELLDLGETCRSLTERDDYATESGDAQRELCDGAERDTAAPSCSSSPEMVSERMGAELPS